MKLETAEWIQVRVKCPACGSLRTLYFLPHISHICTCKCSAVFDYDREVGKVFHVDFDMFSGPKVVTKVTEVIPL